MKTNDIKWSPLSSRKENDSGGKKKYGRVRKKPEKERRAVTQRGRGEGSTVSTCPASVIPGDPYEEGGGGGGSGPGGAFFSTLRKLEGRQRHGHRNDSQKKMVPFRVGGKKISRPS